MYDIGGTNTNNHRGSALDEMTVFVKNNLKNFCKELYKVKDHPLIDAEIKKLMASGWVFSHAHDIVKHEIVRLACDFVINSGDLNG